LSSNSPFSDVAKLPGAALAWIVFPLLTMLNACDFQDRVGARILALMAPVRSIGDCSPPKAQAPSVECAPQL
jgi:hypothetical protein